MPNANLCFMSKIGDLEDMTEEISADLLNDT